MGLLNDVSSAANTVGNVASSVASGIGKVVSDIGNALDSTSSAPPNTLPSGRVPSQRQGINKRHIINWFVPEVGMISMYINPQKIDYNYKKVITTERTKGGYVSQYWGEELPTLTISGHTGSSGVEGLNVLYEIYRAEQYNFDPIGLTIASDSTLSGLGDLINNAGQGIGGLAGDVFSSATNGILGLNPLTQSILPRNPPTLSSMAFAAEMYYMGWVFRGFFTDMNVTESVDRMGLFDYTIHFTVTQRRGYRLNNFDFQRSANSGPSNNSEGAIPLSYGTGTSFGR